MKNIIREKMKKRKKQQEMNKIIREMKKEKGNEEII